MRPENNQEKLNLLIIFAIDYILIEYIRIHRSFF